MCGLEWLKCEIQPRRMNILTAAAQIAKSAKNPIRRLPSKNSACAARRNDFDMVDDSGSAETEVQSAIMLA